MMNEITLSKKGRIDLDDWYPSRLPRESSIRIAITGSRNESNELIISTSKDYDFEKIGKANAIELIPKDLLWQPNLEIAQRRTESVLGYGKDDQLIFMKLKQKIDETQTGRKRPSSLLEAIREYRRDFVLFGTSTIFALTLFLIISGIVLDRLVIAPDFGVTMLILSITFWLMAWFSNFERRKLNHD